MSVSSSRNAAWPERWSGNRRPRELRSAPGSWLAVCRGVGEAADLGGLGVEENADLWDAFGGCFDVEDIEMKHLHVASQFKVAGRLFQHRGGEDIFRARTLPAPPGVSGGS